MSEENNTSFNDKLFISLQLINVFIGAVITLICVAVYITIEVIFLRGLIIIAAVSFGIVCFINLNKNLHKPMQVHDEESITGIELVNEANEIIKTWDIGERISLLIGKNGGEEEVSVDLTCSIYSDFIENTHAVLNYAAGQWYIEDLSENSGVSIQKPNNIKYRVIKDAPCELNKGDILFISKVKLLIR